MAVINATIKLTRVCTESSGEPFDRATTIILEGSIGTDTFVLRIEDIPNKELQQIHGILEKEILIQEAIGVPVHGDAIDMTTMNRLARGNEESEG